VSHYKCPSESFRTAAANPIVRVEEVMDSFNFSPSHFIGVSGGYPSFELVFFQEWKVGLVPMFFWSSQ
jgi:hypothetical protein